MRFLIWHSSDFKTNFKLYVLYNAYDISFFTFRELKVPNLERSG
jgi:hypothetical protein